ncbi:hypothetical protein [Sandaracinobacteroides saxicola]|uniref:Imelysin-like domain-containing protein n=1 Tax=Sandaracinobacteroides saxicola TaxID=2759707 RepID=A0A7G5IH25_9SPHN|nr:hypothetical protein [Sandaracinobacteroides saxicola]QMW22667.1 hypothetical protein H3309_15395 [Sandaracinobacteroides saxicola]
MRVLLLALPLLLAGCARDVVLKPAVITFNTQARTAVAAAERQYDETIIRLNQQTADFLARNPDCGLALDIVPRRLNTPGATPAGAGYCLSEAEKAALTGPVKTERLPLASRETFAAQFRALGLLVDYVSFLAKHADDPSLTAAADIQSTANAVKGLGQGLSSLKTALGGEPIAEFANGGPVEKFATALASIAGQFELIAKQANDVSALERAIKSAQVPIGGAIDTLADSADAWACAALERRQIDANSYALNWSPKLASLDPAARKEVAQGWVNRAQFRLPAFCPGSDSPAAIRGEVATMLLGVKQAQNELLELANHNYTPAQRKAIIEATLSRLGTLLSRIATLVPVLP